MLITKELLQEYVSRYSSRGNVIGWKVYGDGTFLHIMYEDWGETEIIDLYLDWLVSRRNSKIEDILDGDK